MQIRTNKQGGGTGRKQRWLGEDSLEKLELFTSDWELNPLSFFFFPGKALLGPLLQQRGARIKPTVF